jgi:hypothetical protein
MAEKHKSKYKKPENTKYKSRKDLKDYTADDKKGGLNPNSAGEKQSNVLRKTDKETVDTGDMYVKYNADDRLYKDVEDGEYDPKHAAKVLKKRQDKDEKDNAKNIEDKIENLTREQKERLVREYIRRKITKVILEAEGDVDPAAEEDPLAATDPASAEAPVDTVAAPMTDPAAAPDPTATTPAAPVPVVEPTAAAPAAEVPAEEQQAINVKKYVDSIKAAGTINQVKSILQVSKDLTAEVEPADKLNYYRLLMRAAKENIIKLSNASSATDEIK